jgi:hypothetical protein
MHSRSHGQHAPAPQSRHRNDRTRVAIMPMFSSPTIREIGTANNVYPHFLEPKSYRTASMDPAMTKIGSNCDIIRVQR